MFNYFTVLVICVQLDLKCYLWYDIRETRVVIKLYKVVDLNYFGLLSLKSFSFSLFAHMDRWQCGSKMCSWYCLASFLFLLRKRKNIRKKLQRIDFLLSLYQRKLQSCPIPFYIHLRTPPGRIHVLSSNKMPSEQ